jgi:hypothetical protein
VAFIYDWLSTMLNLFNEMKDKTITHGDFHTGNILVEDQSAYNLIGPPYAFRVTDFGVAEATSDHRFKDDYQQLANVLQELLQTVRYADESQKDKFIFKILRDHFVARHLMETDPTRDPLARQPAELLKRLMELDAEFARSAEAEPDRLLTPFDFLSCEQIGHAPALLHALYSDRFLGLPEIQSQNNVVVTGPRGCGKTTVFRSQSLDQRLLVNDATPDNTLYIGVYYRCDDLYFAFPRYKLPNREAAIDIPVHFVTATLVAKLLDSTERWGRQYFPAELTRVEAKTAERLWKALGLPIPQTPGYATLRAIYAAANRERVKAADRYRFANDPGRSIGYCFGPDVLATVCEVLNDNLSFIRSRPIFFFIDDYSMPKVTKDLQANLNRVFMQRASVCFFKLSTESPVSFVKHDIDNKNYVESREYVLQNLGLVYLHTGVGPKLSFVEDVFRRRLAEIKTPFPAKELEELTGSNINQNYNEIARRIRDDEKPSLWGKETLCNLCSGDIHYLISLVGSMVRLCGGPQQLKNVTGGFMIPPEKQTQAIREEAGRFLKNLRGAPHLGDQLVSIVEAFGNVAISHLKYLNSKNEKSSPPKQANRIEPYEPFSLSTKGRELLRYSVFIEDYRGRSRRGNIVPRLYLRRFLIPHFNLTFSTRDSIELEPMDFEAFLLNPKAFEQKFRLKSSDDAKRYENYEGQIDKQPPLPGT